MWNGEHLLPSPRTGPPIGEYCSNPDMIIARFDWRGQIKFVLDKTAFINDE
jgi:hypothetical protein